MPSISIMLKPSSSNCNLRCKYCFYHSLSKRREAFSHGQMSLSTLEAVISKAFSYAGSNAVALSFQGGEPLLCGKEFFSAVPSLVKKYNTQNAPVSIAVQTNGTLIDKEWCAIFKNLKALVGLSMDGEADEYRVDASGTPSFEKAYETAKLLQHTGVEFNILTVLTKPVARNIKAVLDFFKRNHFRYLQFIPCLRPIDGGNEVGVEYMDEDDYLFFLHNAFEFYTHEYAHGNYVSIRYFDNLVALAHGARAEQCGICGHCTHQFVVEGDGATYPCDFYCLDEYCLGNVNTLSFAELEHSPIAEKFITESLVVDERCKKCNVYKLCRNGCKRERGDIPSCSALKTFLPTALPYLARMN